MTISADQSQLGFGVSGNSQTGVAAFTSGGATFVDIVFANNFSFTGPYSIFLTVFNSKADVFVTVNATLRPGDPGPAPAANGFRIQVSTDFDGCISWKAAY